MNGGWQTWVALGVVAVTIVAFIVRAVRRQRASRRGCVNAADCGCGDSRLSGSFRAQHGHK